MDLISVNGQLQPASQPALLATNRGYRYGDGIFETMKIRDGQIQLGSFHFDRLFRGLSLLKFSVPALFTQLNLQEEILQLCKMNACDQLARVRLSVSRGNSTWDTGGEIRDAGTVRLTTHDSRLTEASRPLHYIIESWPLENKKNELNAEGLVLGVFTEAQKSCDSYSNLKSSAALPYAMAALFAREQKWDDALVLNTNNRIADTSIANIFIIKNGEITTPGLEEGCVDGVMRRYLIESLRDAGYGIRETSLGLPGIESADEIFLTNAIRGIRWVKQFGPKNYTGQMTREIYEKIGRTIPF